MSSKSHLGENQLCLSGLVPLTQKALPIKFNMLVGLQKGRTTVQNETDVLRVNNSDSILISWDTSLKLLFAVVM